MLLDGMRNKSVYAKGGWEVIERRRECLRRGAETRRWLGLKGVSGGADTLVASTVPTVSQPTEDLPPFVPAMPIINQLDLLHETACVNLSSASFNRFLSNLENEQELCRGWWRSESY